MKPWSRALFLIPCWVLPLALFLWGTLTLAAPVPAPGTGPGTAKYVAADTLEIDLHWPASWPEPLALLAGPDSLAVGGILRVAVDIPDSLQDVPDSLLSGPVPWLVDDLAQPGLRSWRSADDHGLPWPGVPAKARRLVRSLRVLGLDPFTVRTPGWSSPVVTVVPRLAAVDSVAPVRDPLRPGWSPSRMLIGILAALALSLLLGGWIWSRRRPARRLPHVPPPGYPWYEAVCGLEALWESGRLDRGDIRGFLDGLAGLTRRYSADRFGIPASGLTGDEIREACLQRAFPAAAARELGQVVTMADALRYDPAPPPAGLGREMAAGFLGAMAKVRILPVYGCVPPELALRGDAAWSRLARELGVEGTDEIRGGAA